MKALFTCTMNREYLQRSSRKRYLKHWALRPTRSDSMWLCISAASTERTARSKDCRKVWRIHFLIKKHTMEPFSAILILTVTKMLTITYSLPMMLFCITQTEMTEQKTEWTTFLHRWSCTFRQAAEKLFPMRY